MSTSRTLLALLALLLAGAPCAADSGVAYVKKKRFNLLFDPKDPKLGAQDKTGSGVERAELWLSTDEGKSWSRVRVMDNVKQRIKTRPGKKPFFPFEASQGDGEYWFIFRMEDAAKHWSVPQPSAGARPMARVVLDTTAPRLDVLHPADGMKIIGGKNIYVEWTMQDAHPRATPVQIDFRFDPKQPWATLGSKLPETGKLPLPLPFAKHPKAALRITASDRLGNATTLTRNFSILTVPDEEQLARRKRPAPAQRTPRKRPSRGVADPGPRVLQLCARARSLLEEARYEQALRVYQEALALQPRYVPAVFDAGICHFYLKRYKQAWQQFDAALELDPDNAGLYLRRGHAHFQRGQHTPAMNDLGKAVALSGSDHLLEIQGLDLIAEIHRTRQAYAAAIDAWQRITQIGDPDHALVRAARRNIERYRGQAGKK